jgi:predicted membrane protein
MQHIDGGDFTAMKNITARRLALAALFLALGLALPFLTGQIAALGQALLPMHLPALLCGFILGPELALVVGFVMPLLRSVIFGMPPLFPTATAMAFELAAYGFLAGLLYQNLAQRGRVYFSLIGAMLGGRVVWGVVSLVLYGLQGKAFSWQLFIAGAFANALPGIVVQLILIPLLVIALERAQSSKQYTGRY